MANGMRKINDDGSAFPNITPDMIVNGGPGMSLRDWFAGQVMAAMLSRSDAQAPDENGLAILLSIVANHSYAAADALLKSREAIHD